MARILLAWELGYGYSHLANLEVLARALGDTGHVLGVAARDLDAAHLFFGGLRVQYFQAPIQTQERPLGGPLPAYAQLLHVSGLGEPAPLLVRLSAWMGLIGAFAPDLVVAEHAPTALLAARISGTRRILLGSGFAIPPPGRPLGPFPDVAQDRARASRLEEDEESVLRTVNLALGAAGGTPMTRLDEIYHPHEGELLMTHAELDPFPRPKGIRYRGVWSRPDPSDTLPPIPDGAILAYLAPHSGIDEHLRALALAPEPVVLIAPRIAPTAVPEGVIHLPRLVGLERVAARASLVVTHGSHSTMALTLRRGLPQLAIPLYREQLFTARRLAQQDAAVVHDADDPDLARSLEAARAPAIREGSGTLASRYGDFDQRAEAISVVEELEEVLSSA